MFSKDMPSELDLDTIYTGDQIIAFVCQNPDTLVITADCVNFLYPDKKEYKVVEKRIAYVHRGEGQSYQMPSNKTKIYIMD